MDPGKSVLGGALEFSVAIPVFQEGADILVETEVRVGCCHRDMVNPDASLLILRPKSKIRLRARAPATHDESIPMVQIPFCSGVYVMQASTLAAEAADCSTWSCK